MGVGRKSFLFLGILLVKKIILRENKVDVYFIIDIFIDY